MKKIPPTNSADARTDADRVDRLERLGILRRAVKRPDLALLSGGPPTPAEGADPVGRIIEERQTGR